MGCSLVEREHSRYGRLPFPDELLELWMGALGGVAIRDFHLLVRDNLLQWLHHDEMSE